MDMSRQNRFSAIFNHPSGIFSLIAVGVLLVLLLWIPESGRVISGYGHFFPLGLVGAIAANSTGAGGGIVFIPAFTSLGVDGVDALGTSLAIQCFGMTAGSISWLISIYRHQHGGRESVSLTQDLLVVSGLSSVMGMLVAQYVLPQPEWPVTTIFKYFSIAFGVVLLYVTLQKHRRRSVHHLRKRDMPLLFLVSFVGGMITSWISIGSGEWIALLLFFLGYPTMVAVCVAVCVSSITVLSGIGYHLFVTDTIVWQILLFSAPAAIVGGSVARLLAERLGPTRLKIFFGAWILATGFAM